MSAILDFFAGVADGLLAIVEFLGQAVADVLYVVQLLGTVVSDVPAYLSFLPVPLLALVTSILVVVVVYKILGRD